MLQALTRSEMQAFEKYACDNFAIMHDDMMQNAGKAVFDLVMNEIKPERVLIVSGKGNNGGDALVTARLLKEAGIDVTVLSPYSDEEFTEEAGRELNRVKELDIRISNQKSQISNFDLIIDGLFGFSLSDNPRPPVDKIIEQINCSGIPILAVDVPSGLEAKTGQIMEPCVKAAWTITLGMPKIGLDKHREYVGKLYLGNLGIPDGAYEKLGIYSPIFFGKNYISLD